MPTEWPTYIPGEPISIIELVERIKALTDGEDLTDGPA